MRMVKDYICLILHTWYTRKAGEDRRQGLKIHLPQKETIHRSENEVTASIKWIDRFILKRNPRLLSCLESIISDIC